MAEKKSSLADIASAVGLSVSVVSRVLRQEMGKTRVNEANMAKIREVAREMNYIPSYLTRDSWAKQSKNIGIIFSELNNPFHYEILNFFDEYAQSRGYHIIMSNTHHDESNEFDRAQMFLAYMTTGIVVMPSSKNSQRRIIEHHKGDDANRIVYFGISYYEKCNYSILELDSDVENLVKELHQRGYTKIGFIGSSETPFDGRDRYRAYLKALKQLGLQSDYSININDSKPFMANKEEVYAQMSSYIKTSREFAEVYIAYNDIIALGGMQAFKDAGKSIPKDVGFVTVDNTLETRAGKTPMSSLVYDYKKMVSDSIEAIIQSKPLKQHMRAEIAWRASTR